MKANLLKQLPFLLAAIAITTSFSGVATAQKKKGKKDIVDTAVGAGQFNTLVAAVKAAGLVDTLKGDGPFTVFAPTDEAFAKLPEGTVASLLKPENKDKLVDILTYHVVSGNVPSTTAVTLTEANAVNSKKLKLKVDGGKLFINNAQVVKADINTSNGVIHVIDNVLLPPTNQKGESKAAGKIDRPSVQSVIHTALHKGGNQFDHHNIGATIAIYEVTAKALLMLPKGELSGKQREHLNNALHSGGGHRHKAWVLYQALNAAK